MRTRVAGLVLAFATVALAGCSAAGADDAEPASIELAGPVGEAGAIVDCTPAVTTEVTGSFDQAAECGVGESERAALFFEYASTSAAEQGIALDDLASKYTGLYTYKNVVIATSDDVLAARLDVVPEFEPVTSGAVPSPSPSVGTLAYGFEQWASGIDNADATEMYTALFVIANRAEEDCLAGLEAGQADWLREKVATLKADLAGVGEGTTGADLLLLGSSTVKALDASCSAD